jgi:hypothetical protein
MRQHCMTAWVYQPGTCALLSVCVVGGGGVATYLVQFGVVCMVTQSDTSTAVPCASLTPKPTKPNVSHTNQRECCARKCTLGDVRPNDKGQQCEGPVHCVCGAVKHAAQPVIHRLRGDQEITILANGPFDASGISNTFASHEGCCSCNRPVESPIAVTLQFLRWRVGKKKVSRKETKTYAPGETP